jgi:hypothetical protein
MEGRSVETRGVGSHQENVSTAMESLERAGQDAEAGGSAGDQALAIYRTSKQAGPGRAAHKISNHGLTARTRQPAHAREQPSWRCTTENERHPQRTVCAAVGGGDVKQQ